jgi:hypothetical protein
MMWIVIFHLACLAVALEFMYRAPEVDEEGRAVRQPRRAKRPAASLPPIALGPLKSRPKAP